MIIFVGTGNNSWRSHLIKYSNIKKIIIGFTFNKGVMILIDKKMFRSSQQSETI